VAPEALDRLVGHDWPGNVRELENVIQRAMVMATTGVILPEHLPIGPVSAAASVAVDATVEEIIEGTLLVCARAAGSTRLQPLRPPLRPLRPHDRAGGEAAATGSAAGDRGGIRCARLRSWGSIGILVKKADGARNRSRRPGDLSTSRPHLALTG